ncbi:MAG: hypothetical protein Q8M95_04235 [Candidatus Methanoperedens sp.]|nr:hypothetical protein [Candidatus Methanoperedens sp.]
MANNNEIYDRFSNSAALRASPSLCSGHITRGYLALLLAVASPKFPHCVRELQIAAKRYPKLANKRGHHR